MNRTRSGVAILLGLVIVALASCGPLPKPFRSPTSEAGAPALVAGDTAGGVRVVLLEGLTTPMAQLLSKSVSEHLVARGIPAAVEEGKALRYTLRGRVEEIPEDQATGGAIARIHWRLIDHTRLSDRNTDPFLIFSQDVKGTDFDWQWGSPRVIKAVGAIAGQLIAEAVEPEDETLKPVRQIIAGVWLQPIRGAPGDGDKSLTRAMRYALIGAKVPMAAERITARHILRGDISVGLKWEGGQNVEIQWTVSYPDGRHLGNAVQRNLVAAGTFERPWGETAAVIAAAAVPGIKEVLDQAENLVRPRLGSDRRLRTGIVSAPGTPSLPLPTLILEPGRPSYGQRRTNW